MPTQVGMPAEIIFKNPPRSADSFAKKGKGMEGGVGLCRGNDLRSE